MVERKHDRIACEEYEARLVALLEQEQGTEPDADPALQAHLGRCDACRDALEAARLGQALLRGGLEPAAEPSGAFATRVMAAIRTEESRRQQFWKPLEVLASRLALTAAALLLILSAWLYEMTPARTGAPTSAQGQITDGFPQPVGEPSSKDEILLSLAERNHGQ